MELVKNDSMIALFENQKSGRFEALKAEAFNAFQNQGWPTRKDEEYKFTPIEQLLKKGFDFETAANDLRLTLEEVSAKFYPVDGHHLVFLNGTYRKDLSKHSVNEIEIHGFDELPETEVEAIIQKTNDQRASVTFNRAFISNGLVIHAKHATPLLPIFIYHFRGGASNSISCPAIAITAEQNAHLRIYERTFSIGEVSNFASHVTTISVARHASVRYTKIQDHKPSDFTLDNLFVDQAKESQFYANTFSLSGALIRNNLEISLNGEHSEANMYGLYLLDGKAHVDNHTVVDHKFPNCDSNELYKGIVDENSTGVFNGKIFVRQPAQKTNAFQANNNISLSDSATIHTKPQLEIWADDVKCSHGCTVGQLDEEALFYLQSRGVNRSAALAMLLNAFAKESLNHVQLDLINEEIVSLIQERLGA